VPRWGKRGVGDASEPSGHDPYLSLRFRDFRLLLTGVFISSFGQQMAAVALGWELFNRTGSALVLGFVGLAQFIPLAVLSLPAGHVADRFSRKRVVAWSEGIAGLASLGLAFLSFASGPLPLFYACLVAIGAASTFAGPASSALVAATVPEHAFASATTWRSSSWQLSAVVGPAAGGFLTGAFGGAAWVFVLNAAAALIFLLALAPIHDARGQRAGAELPALRAVGEGIRFVTSTPVLMAAITLDLFAVLFGGAVALLPIFARNILHVGPFGLGWLQAASSVGAVCMAIVMAHRATFRRAGPTLLLAVAGFGLATIGFGLSRWFAVSLLMLFLLGALDNVSVVIRSTLVLLRTPDEMRGRVGAVNGLFVGTSNQLGGFESGLAAQLFGPVVSVVAGGVATVLVVIAVAWVWPEMRRLRALTETAEAA
jgi:MFS family permease